MSYCLRKLPFIFQSIIIRIMMCNLHWCYTFCTGVTLFALVLHLNCTALSQSESSNFFMYIISARNSAWSTGVVVKKIEGKADDLVMFWTSGSVS